MLAIQPPLRHQLTRFSDDSMMSPTATPVENSRFPTTRWTIIRQAGKKDHDDARSALDSLCRQYWRPLHAFVRSLGLSEADAADQVQEFLSQFVASGGFAKAEEPKGRLRNYLLRAIRNQITDQWRHDNAQKRPSKKDALPLEVLENEASLLEFCATTKGTEAFDREWAKEIMDRTLEKLRLSYTSRKKEPLFHIIRKLTEHDKNDPEIRAGLCAELGMSSNALGVEIHRFRNRLANAIRETILDTVESGEDIEDELRYLASVLGQ
jgi:DNA-directed RNA polymerase specialized sigma24 family protein